MSKVREMIKTVEGRGTITMRWPSIPEALRMIGKAQGSDKSELEMSADTIESLGIFYVSSDIEGIDSWEDVLYDLGCLPVINEITQDIMDSLTQSSPKKTTRKKS